MQTIAVLLTVFNRKDKTLECLKRLYNQLPLEGYQVTIYLTNDGCTDGTPEAIHQKFPQVHIISGNGNLYWNRGMYTAWEEAAKNDYDFYLWLNDDTFVYSDMLHSLLQATQIKCNKAIIIGATQSTDHSTTTYGGRLANEQIVIPNGKLTQVHHFNGNIVLVPKYVFQKLGNLDYYFTHSKGDFDYGLRAQKKGISMYQCGHYLGECDSHSTIDKWCDPHIPFKQRWKALNRPNGMPPKETFHLEIRHHNLLIASFHFCTIYLRCFFPLLWNKRNKKLLK